MAVSSMAVSSMDVSSTAVSSTDPACFACKSLPSYSSDTFSATFSTTAASNLSDTASFFPLLDHSYVLYPYISL